MITDDNAVTKGLIRLALVALCAGAVTGVAGALFRLTLTWADKTRLEVLAYSHQYPYLGWLIPVIAAAVCVCSAAQALRILLHATMILSRQNRLLASSSGAATSVHAA